MAAWLIRARPEPTEPDEPEQCLHLARTIVDLEAGRGASVTRGGRTDLANLVLVCARHHDRLHQPGWHAKLLPDGSLEVTAPNGEVRGTSPPRAEVPW